MYIFWAVDLFGVWQGVLAFTLFLVFQLYQTKYQITFALYHKDTDSWKNELLYFIIIIRTTHEDDWGVGQVHGVKEAIYFTPPTSAALHLLAC